MPLKHMEINDAFTVEIDNWICNLTSPYFHDYFYCISVSNYLSFLSIYFYLWNSSLWTLNSFKFFTRAKSIQQWFWIVANCRKISENIDGIQTHNASLIIWGQKGTRNILNKAPKRRCVSTFPVNRSTLVSSEI